MIRYVIVTQDDPFFLPEFFKEFERLTHGEQQLQNCGLVIQKPLGKKSPGALMKQMYDFYGPVGFMYKAINYVNKKIGNLLAVRLFKGKFPGAFSVRHFALKSGMKILDQSDVNSTEFIQWIRENKIDLIVSVGGSQKFKSGILNAPRYGCINIHNSKLPKLRGMLPTFWALLEYDKDPVSASTVFKMDENLDSGPIILQETFELNPKEPLEKLILRTKRQGAHLIYRVLRMYLEGEPKYTANVNEEATYFSFPRKEDVSIFRNKGLRIISRLY